MTADDFILGAFATAIWAKVAICTQVGRDAAAHRRLLASIYDDIGKYTGFRVPRVSEAARAKAAKLRSNLACVGWHDQPRFDRDRLLFHREHCVPVKHFRARCLSAESVEVVAEALRAARVAWILNAEDLWETSLGYRFERVDPDAAYWEAGINLV